MAAEHTCELRAWRGRPPARPRGRGRGPGRPLTPCSLARSITHTRARPAAARPPPGGDARGGRHQSGKQRGKTPNPRPRAHTGGNRNITQRDPGGYKVHGVRRACIHRESPQPQSGQSRGAGQALPRQSHGHVRERKPASSETRLHVPGSLRQGSGLHGTQCGSPSAWISVPPARSQSGQPRPGAQNGHPPRAQAAVPLSGPPGLRPRADSGPGGRPDPQLRDAPPRLPAPRR